MKIEEQMHFSYDLESSLTDEERQANAVLQQLKSELKNDTFDITNLDYFETLPKMLQTKLYKVLDAMPKGGLHHIHTTAAPSADFYVKLTYHDFVYFNEREQLFKVAPKGLDEDGFIKCTEMRKFWPSAEEYDEKLKNYIRMTPFECQSKESHKIWNYFQNKFTLINDLGKYYKFF
mmetsp:Transcript_22996/g.17437  ORF Transcript_22996/g.17437 Transcript_22996/m.17437 type:complete len:176 (-) Transcript_22996:2058-2585(-)